MRRAATFKQTPPDAPAVEPQAAATVLETEATVIEMVPVNEPPVTVSAEMPVEPPKIKVQFEFQNVPMEFISRFHQVVVLKDRAVILVFDTRYDLIDPSFPTESDQEAVLAISERPEILYRVKCNGFRFPLNNLSICVLPLVDVRRLEA